MHDAKVLIRGGRAFDGTRSIGEADILIAGEKISAVGPRLPVDDDVQIVEAQGCTVLPGLIDAHVHTWERSQLERCVTFGVTTVLDMFCHHLLAAGLRAEQAAGNASDRSDFSSAGTLVTAPGGHGTQYGIPIPTVRTRADAEAVVSGRVEEGSEWIKVVLESGRYWGRNVPTLDDESLRAVIAAAKSHHKLAVVHATTHAEASQAIRAGADALAHLFADEPPSADFGRLVADSGAFVVPTMSVIHAASGRRVADDDRLAPYLLRADHAVLQTSYTQMDDPAHTPAGEALRSLQQAGVAILAGTDVGNPGVAWGASLHGELELLVRAGLSASEALAAATSVPAHCFGLADRGRLQPGLRADVVVVQGDPTRDILATRDIVAVFKQGQRVDRQGLRDAVAQERERITARRSMDASPGSGDGRISDFESGRASSRFGAGWIASTDTIFGGGSSASIEVVEGGAAGTRRSLRVHGEVRQAGSPVAFAGTMFYPGEVAMAPADLSRFDGVAFYLKGQEGSLQALIFSASRGGQPAGKVVRCSPEWQRHVVRFDDVGIGSEDIVGIAFVGGPQPGSFEFQLDEVELVGDGDG